MKLREKQTQKSIRSNTQTSKPGTEKHTQAQSPTGHTNTWTHTQKSDSLPRMSAQSLACTHSLLPISLTSCLCNHFTPDEYVPVLPQTGGRGSLRMKPTFPDRFIKSPHGSPEVPLIGVLGEEDEKGQSGRKRENDTREND